MAFMRKQYEAAFKAKVALEAVKGEKTIAQIASAYKVHPNQIRQWRLRLLERPSGGLLQPSAEAGEGPGRAGTELFRQIGQLKVEVEWLK